VRRQYPAAGYTAGRGVSMTGAINVEKPRLSKKSFGERLLKNIKVNWELYLFCIPGLVLLIIFYYTPMYDGVAMAFKDYMPSKGVAGSEWVGLKNFKRLFNTYNFWQYLKNTLTLSLYSLIAGFPLPIIFALMINEVRNKRFKKIIQTISYAPNFISTVVLVGMINLFFSPVGIVNNIIRGIGFEEVQFFMDSSYFPHLYVWSGIWQSLGFNSIIYIAALSNIDPQLCEAAIIDGASKLKRIWYIDLPGIVPTAVILLILSVGSIMGVAFEKILLMQSPLNLEVSEVISTYVYKVGIVSARYSFSAAVGIFNSVVNFILLIIVNFVAGKLSETKLW